MTTLNRFALIIAGLVCSTCQFAPAAAADRADQRGDWWVTETANFSVWSHDAQQSGSAAELCESTRAALVERWCAATRVANWTPRCYIVLHATQREFRRESGAAGDLTVASTTVTTDEGRIVYRRVDLREDARDWRENALPHELTHVLFADLFPGSALPQWLSEGAAMTSESDRLRQDRCQLLLDAGGTRPSLPSILARHFPPRCDPNLAYATSYAVVEHLRGLEGDARFLEFTGCLLERGCEAALWEMYGIEGGIRELERDWTASLTRDARSLSMADASEGSLSVLSD